MKAGYWPLSSIDIKNGDPMKTLVAFSMTFFSLAAFSATSFQNSFAVQEAFEKSSLPDFSPWISESIPGRCFFKANKETKTASALVVSQLEEGLAIAPLSADQRAPTFFDKLSYIEITTRFPQLKNLYRNVTENEKEAVLYKTESKNEFEARIRESEDHFLVKVILKDQTVRYCYYIKG